MPCGPHATNDGALHKEQRPTSLPAVWIASNSRLYVEVVAFLRAVAS